MGIRSLAGALISLAVLIAAGCVTERVQTAARRAELAAKDRGERGDALLAAVGREMEEANKELGADAIPAEAVPLTVEAAAENAAGMVEEREARTQVLAFFKTLLTAAGDKWPWLAGALGVGGTIIELVRRLLAKGKMLVSARKAVTAAITLTQAVKEKLKAGKFTLAEFEALYRQGKAEGEGFVAGSRELYEEYLKLKAEWKAKGAA